jgi:hypothetical protein
MRTFIKKFQPEIVVDRFDELSEMSAWLGQRYHHLMKSRYCSRVETTQQSPDHVTWSEMLESCLEQ